MVFPRPSGFAAFTTLWAGQMLSAVGTRMTNFALSLWLWQRTGSATDLSLLMFCSFGATVVFSPLAGALIDRWSRRLIIMLSDAGSVLVTGLLLVTFTTGSVAVWQLYAANLITGAFLSFQLPTYSATISLMMAKGSYPKANGMLSAVRFGPLTFAPTAALLLLAATDITTVLLVDMLSYLVAIGTVLVVNLPDTPGGTTRSVWRDSVAGFHYITRCRPLLGMEIVMFMMGLFSAIGYAILIPMILARGGSDADAGITFSVGGVGGVVGAVLIASLRPTRDKMFRVLLGILVFSLVGRVLFGVSDVLWLWAAAQFVLHLCVTVIDGYSQAIWQEKVEPAMQGRVFAARQLIENLSIPLGLLFAGTVADHVIGPMMMPGGSLAPVFGWLVGVGEGSGMGLISVGVGVIGVIMVVFGFAVPNLRRLESVIPDHDEVSAGRV